MPKSSLRLAVALACLLVSLAVFAGASAGSRAVSGASDSPDLVVTGTPSAPNPKLGDSVVFFVTVNDANAAPATDLWVNVTLGAGLQYLSSSVDRGQGCVSTGTTTLRCSLDWLSHDVLNGHLEIATKVVGDDRTFVATAVAQQGTQDAARSTLSLTLNAKTSISVPTGLNGDGTPTTTQDKKRPTARALASAGVRGHSAKLLFRIYDDQGVAKALGTVMHAGKVVGRPSTGFGPVVYGGVYYVDWRVPAGAARGAYTFCVVAADRAGNRSPSSCALLAVK